MITEERAREIASQWHGGQWTALHGFASSGVVTPNAIKEADRDLRECRTADRKNRKALQQLLGYLYSNLPDPPLGAAYFDRLDVDEEIANTEPPEYIREYLAHATQQFAESGDHDTEDISLELADHFIEEELELVEKYLRHAIAQSVDFLVNGMGEE